MSTVWQLPKGAPTASAWGTLQGKGGSAWDTLQGSGARGFRRCQVLRRHRSAQLCTSGQSSTQTPLLPHTYACASHTRVHTCGHIYRHVHTCTQAHAHIMHTCTHMHVHTHACTPSSISLSLDQSRPPTWHRSHKCRFRVSSADPSERQGSVPPVSALSVVVAA